MNQKQKIVFIINPISGIGKQKTIEKLVPKYLDLRKFDYHYTYSEYAGHARLLAKEAIEKGFDIIAVVGGDGSVHEVSESLKQSGKTMAIIPTGSGNGIARHFKIPLKPIAAIQLLNDFAIADCDTGLINNQHFIGFAGIGFDAHIAHEFAKLGQRGFVGYAKVVLRELKKFKSPEVSITNEKNEILSGRAFILTIANVREYGNGVTIEPSANASDGLFTICVLDKIPIGIFPFTLLLSFRGKIDQSKYFKKITGSRFRITTKGRPRIHLDGEATASDNQEFIVENMNMQLKIAVKANHKSNYM